MNAAARLLKQNTLSKTQVFSVLLSKVQFSVLMLIFAVLISALSMVYVTNITRGLNAGLQQSLSEGRRLHLQTNQLLLERGSLLTQARIQQVAVAQFDMVVPNSQSVVIVNE